MHGKILPYFEDKERREARAHAAGDVDYPPSPAVMAAINAFLDQQKGYLEAALRDSDSDEFARWNESFTAATAR